MTTTLTFPEGFTITVAGERTVATPQSHRGRFYFVDFNLHPYNGDGYYIDNCTEYTIDMYEKSLIISVLVGWRPDMKDIWRELHIGYLQ